MLPPSLFHSHSQAHALGCAFSLTTPQLPFSPSMLPPSLFHSHSPSPSQPLVVLSPSLKLPFLWLSSEPHCRGLFSRGIFCYWRSIRPLSSSFSIIHSL